MSIRCILSIDELDIKSDNKYLLYFYTTWSNFHSYIFNLLKKFSIKYKNINVLCIDVEYLKNAQSMYEITHVPSFVDICDMKETRYSSLEECIEYLSKKGIK